MLLPCFAMKEKFYYEKHSAMLFELWYEVLGKVYLTPCSRVKKIDKLKAKEIKVEDLG